MSSVSVILPTYCEAANLRVIVPQIHQALSGAGIDHEIIIVDDNSPDGTPAVCEELARDAPVRLHVRQNERGLATAVLDGMKMAKNDILIVMDADLQHPPAKLPELAAALDDHSFDVALGSRFTPGGEIDGDWGAYRRLLSKVSAWLARPLVAAKDPCAGFIAIRRSTFEDAPPLNPIGYRVGLELMVKCGCKRVAEVPIRFSTRNQGESKLTKKVMMEYLIHLARLYVFRLKSYLGLAHRPTAPGPRDLQELSKSD